jgi:hypothetical protein
LATLPVKTPHALSAKARIVPMMLEDADGLLEASSARFLASFAADVRAYMDPLCHEQWLADNAARQAQRMGRAA